MRYKRLGKTDMNLSVITVGTWAIGGKGWGEVDKKESIDAIHAMIDEGVNSIDTAPAYGDGYSEGVVGEAIKGKRDKLFITTKFLGDKAPHNSNEIEGFIQKCCEDSLERLGTDYVDLYLIHWPLKILPPQETMSALNKLKEQGKILNIGVSNHTENQMLECEKYGQIGAVQPPYSMVNRSHEGLMSWSRQRDIGTMTYGSLGAGILQEPSVHYRNLMQMTIVLISMISL